MRRSVMMFRFKNNLKIILSAIIMSFLIASFISACGADMTETVPDYPAGIGDSISFQGQEFILRDIVHHGDTPMIPTYMENALDDKLLEHYKKTEQKLNCRINLLVGDGSVVAYVLSNLKYADMMNCQFGNIFSYMKAGIAQDYDSIPGIDIHSGKFGNENILSALSWGGRTYGVVAEYWGIPSPYFNDAFLFNPRILRQYSQPNPQELWENEQWTFSGFEQIATAVTDTNSNPNFPIYASGLNDYFYRAAFFANGAAVVKRDSEGRLQYNLPSQEAATATEWLKKLKNELQVFDPESGGWEYYCDMFANGQYAFLAEYSWVGLSKDNGRVGLNMNEEFSWVPFPRGPQGNRDVLATYAEANFAVFVPVNAEISDIGYLMTELFEPLYEGDNYGWRNDFKREVFWDERSYDLYIKILESAVSDDLMYSSSVALVSTLQRIVAGHVSEQQVFEEVADKVQAQLDRDYNSYFD